MANYETPIQRGPDRTLLGAALAIAPAAAGVAIGILIGKSMRKRHRDTVVSSLFVLVAAAFVPTLYDYTSRILNSPKSRIGTQRTLSRIREGGAPWEDAYDHKIEDFEAAYREQQQQ